jgi:TolB-like protein/DNA-binding winged helix-turn-helix (wHTH) protein
MNDAEAADIWSAAQSIDSAKIPALGLSDRLAMASWHSDFFVGEWRVSPKLSSISKGGQTVGVKRKSMAVLACLADANGEVVSRNDIMDDVWPGMTVTDDVLTQSIVELRKAFDDDARHSRVIETIPRVGFRLIATVAPVSIEPDTPRIVGAPRPARRFLLAAMVLLVTGSTLWLYSGRQEGTREPVIMVDEPPSIAVLPFVNMSDDPGNEYFSDGLSEEIRNLLASIPDLKVIGRTSSFAFKGKNEDVRVIGQALGVRTVLEGSVRKLRDRVRITARLVDVSNGVQLWSKTYDRTMTDIFVVQDDVAAAIIDALQIHVGTAPTRGQPTESLDAYAMFLKARAAVNTLDFRVADTLLKEITQLDPNFAEAYELMAYNYWNMAGVEVRPAEAQVLAGEAAAKAIAIDPDLSYARSLHKAAIFGPKLRLRKLEAFEQAVREQPDNVMALEALITLLAEHGYLEEGLYFAERFVELDPLSMIANFHLATMLYGVGRTSEAIAVLEITKEMDLDPTFWMWTLAGVSLIEGRNDDVIANFESWLQQNHYPNPGWFREMVNAAQDPDSGQAYLDDHIPQIMATMPDDDEFDWQYGLTVSYLYFGFLDRFYEKIYATGPTDTTWGGGLYMWVGNIFREQGFTAHPRYLEVSKLLGIIDTWEQRGPPDFCEKTDGQWACE